MQHTPAAAPTVSKSAVLMAHDIDLTGIGDQLAEGVGHHAGLDLRALFGGPKIEALRTRSRPSNSVS